MNMMNQVHFLGFFCFLERYSCTHAFAERTIESNRNRLLGCIHPCRQGKARQGKAVKKNSRLKDYDYSDQACPFGTMSEHRTHGTLLRTGVSSVLGVVNRGTHCCPGVGVVSSETPPRDKSSSAAHKLSASIAPYDI